MENAPQTNEEQDTAIMCGRYWLEKDEESGELVERMNRSPLLNRVPEDAPAAFGEIAPGGIAPALASL